MTQQTQRTFARANLYKDLLRGNWSLTGEMDFGFTGCGQQTGTTVRRGGVV